MQGFWKLQTSQAGLAIKIKSLEEDFLPSHRACLLRRSLLATGLCSRHSHILIPEVGADTVRSHRQIPAALPAVVSWFAIWSMLRQVARVLTECCRSIPQQVRDESGGYVPERAPPPWDS